MRADPRLQAGIAFVLAAAVGLGLARGARVAGVSAVPAVLRTAAVGVVLFGLSGYAAARVLVGGELSVHRALLMLPLGATISSLALAVLGLLHVPLKVSLAIVVVAAALAAALSVARGGAGRGRPDVAQRRAAAANVSVLTRTALPLLLAAIVASVSLIPIFRSGFATVPGQNGDAVLVVGSAVLLEHSPPTANRTDLPINHIPLQWRSKYPIYYALAGIATLAGQDPIRAFATVSALMLALTVLGFFLFARYVLRAPPWVALLAMFLVPLDRIVMYVTIHPYYNELWGQFALPFMLLCGVNFLRSPNRRSAIMFVLFAALGLLAYPLMVPFPAIFLGVFAWVTWRRRRGEGERVAWISSLRIPRPGKRSWLWIPVVLIGVPVALVLVRGFFEKTLSALAVFAPWTSLSGWAGTALSFLPWPRFVGMPSAGAAGVAGLVIVAGAHCAGAVADAHRRSLAARGDDRRDGPDRPVLPRANRRPAVLLQGPRLSRPVRADARGDRALRAGGLGAQIERPLGDGRACRPHW